MNSFTSVPGSMMNLSDRDDSKFSVVGSLMYGNSSGITSLKNNLPIVVTINLPFWFSVQGFLGSASVGNATRVCNCT